MSCIAIEFFSILIQDGIKLQIKVERSQGNKKDYCLEIKRDAEVNLQLKTESLITFFSYLIILHLFIYHLSLAHFFLAILVSLPLVCFYLVVAYLFIYHSSLGNFLVAHLFVTHFCVPL